MKTFDPNSSKYQDFSCERGKSGWLITKKTLGIFWLVIKWFFKGIWWIMKNFKVQTTSLNK